MGLSAALPVVGVCS